MKRNHLLLNHHHHFLVFLFFVGGGGKRRIFFQQFLRAPRTHGIAHITILAYPPLWPLNISIVTMSHKYALDHIIIRRKYEPGPAPRTRWRSKFCFPAMSESDNTNVSDRTTNVRMRLNTRVVNSALSSRVSTVSTCCTQHENAFSSLEKIVYFRAMRTSNLRYLRNS